MEMLERFLKYVKINTQSDETTNTYPSTKSQFDLAQQLLNDLKDLGVEATLTDECIIYAYIPSNTNSTDTIGFIAHMDTAPDASGKNVNPSIIKNYDGKDITLKNGTQIKVSDFPDLERQKGNTLITTDGTTLLGADDKAGITIIMDMIKYFKDNPHVKHTNIAVSFTPDEEIGNGTINFDIKKFKADYAYTVDGGKYDEFSYECFNASHATINITGVGIHPGEAKDKMVNASRIAIMFDTLLPEHERPEYTTKYEGFNHLTSITGDEVSAKLSYILRNHDKIKLEMQKTDFKNVTSFLQTKFPKALITLEIEDDYENMKYILDNHPNVIKKACSAMEKCGVTPVIEPIRGGTDGARLTYLGLPCPNLPTGGYNFHGIREYASYEEMQKCRDYLIEIVKVD